MPTATNHNGSGLNGSHPPPGANAATPSQAVQKGGPFDLAEMERLANEMFRALPGAFLPGIDREQLELVGLDPERAALRPPGVTPPSVNGPMAAAQGALGDVADELDAATMGLALG